MEKNMAILEDKIQVLDGPRFFQGRGQAKVKETEWRSAGCQIYVRILVCYKWVNIVF